MVCTHPPPPPVLPGRGVEPHFQKKKGGGGLTRPQLLEGVTGKEGVTFRGGSCNFHIKNKLKREIFHDKKSI